MASVGIIVAAIIAAAGWLVFVIGFGKQSTSQGAYYSLAVPSKTSAFYFCWWALAVGGLLVNLFFIFKAFSKSKIVGFLPIAGSFGIAILRRYAIFFAAFSLVASGAVINANGQILWQCNKDESLTTCFNDIPTFIKLQFAGSLIYIFMMAISLGGLYYNAIQGEEAYA